MEKELKTCGGVCEKIKICTGGSAKKLKYMGGSAQKICRGFPREYVQGGGSEKKIICTGGGRRKNKNMSHQDLKWNSPYLYCMLTTILSFCF